MGQKSQFTKFVGSAAADDPTCGHPLLHLGGCQWRRERHLQLMIPRELGDVVLKEIHDSPTGGHLGAIQKRFYWIGQHNHVKEWCRRCEKCASYKPPPKYNHAPLQVDISGNLLQRVAMHILGPLPATCQSNSSSSYICTLHSIKVHLEFCVCIVVTILILSLLLLLVEPCTLGNTCNMTSVL